MDINEEHEIKYCNSLLQYGALPASMSGKPVPTGH